MITSCKLKNYNMEALKNYNIYSMKNYNIPYTQKR